MSNISTKRVIPTVEEYAANLQNDIALAKKVFDEKMKIFNGGEYAAEWLDKAVIDKSKSMLLEEQKRCGMELYTGEVEALYSADGGAELDQLDTYNEEFTGLIEDMFEKLPMEKKILEGAELPVYNAKTDFPYTNVEHQQWKNVLPSGCLTTAPTHTSLTGLSNSVSTVEHCRQFGLTPVSDEKSTPSSGNSCSGKLDDFGNEIVAMNESSECTVPMISVLTDGTLSEVKWSPHLKSTESLEATLPDVTLC